MMQAPNILEANLISSWPQGPIKIPMHQQKYWIAFFSQNTYGLFKKAFNFLVL